jgi:hypothetical protein
MLLPSLGSQSSNLSYGLSTFHIRWQTPERSKTSTSMQVSEDWSFRYQTLAITQINRRNSNAEAQCVVELDWGLIPSRTAYQSPQPPKQTEIPDAHLIAA